MADYRGGNYGMSGEAAQAINNINKGDTPYQRKRALIQKAAVTGLTAGITGMAGFIKGQESKREELEGKRNTMKGAIMSAAIANAKKGAAKQSALDAESSKYARQFEQENREADPEYAAVRSGKGLPSSDKTGDNPSYPAGSRTWDASQGAKDALSELDAKDSAMESPVVGTDGQHMWSNEEAFDAANKEAAVNGQDINTARRLMGGLAGTRRY